MPTILQHQPGQKCLILLEVFNADGYDGYDGYRVDPVLAPAIDRIIFPNFSLASNFPQNMTRLDKGLYYFSFNLPTGAAAVGSYLVDVSWVDESISLTRRKIYQVIVTAPFGQYSASTGG